MSSKPIRIALVFVAAACIVLGSSGSGAQTLPTAVLYSQPPSSSGTLYHSSWMDPDGSDWDQWVWDSFILPSTQAITEIQWRGGFDPAYLGSGGPVIDFTVAIYPSIAAGTEPNVVNPPLVEYQTGGDAGQTLAGIFGGTTMYDYQFTLPAAFVATAGTKYWVQIEAWQHGIPDWGLSQGTGGNGSHFRRVYVNYQSAPGDAAFTLLGPLSSCYFDFNGSGTVDAADIAVVADRWHNAALYDPSYDVVEPFGVIDIGDVMTTASYWGQSCP